MAGTSGKWLPKKLFPGQSSRVEKKEGAFLTKAWVPLMGAIFIISAPSVRALEGGLYEEACRMVDSKFPALATKDKAELKVLLSLKNVTPLIPVIRTLLQKEKTVSLVDLTTALKQAEARLSNPMTGINPQASMSQGFGGAPSMMAPALPGMMTSSPLGGPSPFRPMQPLYRAAPPHLMPRSNTTSVLNTIGRWLSIL